MFIKAAVEHIVDNMIPGEKEFIEETLLIEKLARIDSVLNKKAGLLTNIIDGISGSIQGFAKQYIDTSSTSSILESLANIMVPAILFRVNPWLGGLSAIATGLGFDTGRVVDIIKNFVTGKISSGEKPTPDEITNVGMNAVAQQIGSDADDGIVASKDMFDILKQANEKGELIKLAQRGYLSENASGPFLFPERRYGRRGILNRIFGGLGRQRGRWLLGGFIVWIIKTILAGAGLLMLTGAGISLLKGKNKEQPETTEPSNQTPALPAPNVTPVPAPVAPKFQWSGRGAQHHANDNNSMWLVPMNNIPQALLSWAVDVYPEIRNNISQVMNSPSFQNMVGKLEQARDPNSPYIRIPTEYKTRKQIVDAFI